MIPSGSVLHGSEAVRVSVARCYRAFRHTVDAILMACAQLAETVPMYGGSVPAKAVTYLDFWRRISDSLKFSGGEIAYQSNHPNKLLDPESAMNRDLQAVLTDPWARIGSVENLAVLHDYLIGI